MGNGNLDVNNPCQSQGTTVRYERSVDKKSGKWKMVEPIDTSPAGYEAI